MRKDIATKWVQRLRSGDYRQGKAALRAVGEPDTYCCLGVLCEMAVEEGVIVRSTPNSYGHYRYGIGAGAGDTACLPTEVMLWAGMQSVWGIAPGNALYALNDDGVSFVHIADIIDQYTEEL